MWEDYVWYHPDMIITLLKIPNLYKSLLSYFMKAVIHDDVIIHLEPDILEYEVKWALGSITMNKATGCVGFQ